MPDFEPIDEVLKHTGPVISVYEGRFRSPNGEVLVREIARHPGAVAVVAMVGDEVVLVRQYRAAIDQYLLEIPAGKRDVDGEPPIETARRELQEEVGLEPGEIVELCSFYNTPGFCDEYAYVFLATDCVEVEADRQGSEEEFMTIERIGLADVPAMVADGELADGKSILALLMARERLSS